jgi:hypothetical protein
VVTVGLSGVQVDWECATWKVAPGYHSPMLILCPHPVLTSTGLSPKHCECNNVR